MGGVQAEYQRLSGTEGSRTASECSPESPRDLQDQVSRPVVVHTSVLDSTGRHASIRMPSVTVVISATLLRGVAINVRSANSDGADLSFKRPLAGGTRIVILAVCGLLQLRLHDICHRMR